MREGVLVSHPWFTVIDSRITSRSDPASFGPMAGITFLGTPTCGDRRSASRTMARWRRGWGPRGEEGRRGFRGLVMVFAGFGRFGETGP